MNGFYVRPDDAEHLSERSSFCAITPELLRPTAAMRPLAEESFDRNKARSPVTRDLRIVLSK